MSDGQARTRLVRAGGMVGIFTAITLVAACATRPYVLDTPPAPSEEARRHRVFAVGHGWHVGLVMPVSSLVDKLPELKSRFPDARHIEIGWGDKGFYQAQEITTSLTLHAMFWSSGAVIHAVGLPATQDPPFDYFPSSDTVELCVSDRELLALGEFVQRSFLRDAGSHLVSMKEGIYGDSQFYEADGRYHMLNTCNKWVAKGIASMGMSMDPTFKLTSASVLEGLKRSGRVTREGRLGVVTAKLDATCGP
ncbi:MAG: TIGR02117 family protein [Betaproteobacteria bacterium]